MKQIFARCATALALGLALSEAALAQPVPPAHTGPATGLPPYEVVAIVRSVGLEPLHRPQRQGPGYVLRAVDLLGREVRVVVDAHNGRILKVAPLPGSLHAVPVGPPLFGRPPPRIAMAPDGYGPSSRIPMPPELDEPPLIGPGGLPNVPLRAPNAGASPRSVAPPPLPRPRPKVAASEKPAPAAAAPSSPPAKEKDTTGTTGVTPAKPTPPAAVEIDE